MNTDDNANEKTGPYILDRRVGESFFFRDIHRTETDLYGFTVSYIRDGTALLSGDLGCLVWLRNHTVGRPDYGFPDRSTDIDLFAMRCHMASEIQQITEWTPCRAVNEIDSRIRATPQFKYIPERVWVTLDEIKHIEHKNDAGKVEMYAILNEYLEGYPWEKYNFGEWYTKDFYGKFEMLKSVSDLVIDQVNNDLKLRRGRWNKIYK
jgi:hypothetical protein